LSIASTPSSTNCIHSPSFFRPRSGISSATCLPKCNARGPEALTRTALCVFGSSLSYSRIAQFCGLTRQRVRRRGRRSCWTSLGWHMSRRKHSSCCWTYSSSSSNLSSLQLPTKHPHPAPAILWTHFSRYNPRRRPYHLRCTSLHHHPYPSSLAFPQNLHSQYLQHRTW